MSIQITKREDGLFDATAKLHGVIVYADGYSKASDAVAALEKFIEGSGL